MQKYVYVFYANSFFFSLSYNKITILMLGVGDDKGENSLRDIKRRYVKMVNVKDIVIINGKHRKR